MSAKVLQVKVRPGSRVSAFTEQPDGTWLAFVKARPIDGKANEELIRLVSNHFSVGRENVSIRTGKAGPMKLVDVQLPA